MPVPRSTRPQPTSHTSASELRQLAVDEGGVSGRRRGDETQRRDSGLLNDVASCNQRTRGTERAFIERRPHAQHGRSPSGGGDSLEAISGGADLSDALAAGQVLAGVVLVFLL